MLSRNLGRGFPPTADKVLVMRPNAIVLLLALQAFAKVYFKCDCSIGVIPHSDDCSIRVYYLKYLCKGRSYLLV